MRERSRFLLLTVIMVVACVSTAGIAIIVLYKTEVEDSLSRLRVTVQSQARLIESIARHEIEVTDLMREKIPTFTAATWTLKQIRDAHEHYQGFGETGELNLATLRGDSIVFFFRHRHGGLEIPEPIAYDSELAEPMRRALSGLSGTMIGMDPLGNTVLAAYEPVAVLDLGLIAKIDLNEVRASLMPAGLFAILTTLMLASIGTFLFWRVSDPVIKKLQAHSQRLESEINERKQAEKALLASKELYAALAKQSPVGILRADRDGKTTYVNDRWSEITSLNYDQSRGVGWIEALHPDDRGRVTREWNDAIRDGNPFRSEYRFSTPDGGETWVYGLSKRERNKRGEYSGLVCTIIDITERKRLEEKRWNLEQQIRSTQKVESLGVLAGGIVHMFNNILTTILGNVDLALHEIEPQAPVRTRLDAIEKVATQASEISRQMLDYSGKGHFVIKPIDLDELVREMQLLLKISISETAILICNYSENLPPIDGDAIQIRQVIINLTINASEAIGNRRGTISISTGVLACDREYLTNTYFAARVGYDEPLPEGCYVYIEIADTGCGMDEETIAKVFDPFYSTKFTGRGLGMAAVLGIVRGHLGAIEVHSESGKGTTLRVLFPSGSSAA